jgi:hypothetical protein
MPFNEPFVNGAIIATLALYFILGYLIIHSNLVVLARKIKITLKYHRIDYHTFFSGLMEAFLILFVYIGWLGIIIGHLICQTPKLFKRKGNTNEHV